MTAVLIVVLAALAIASTARLAQEHHALRAAAYAVARAARWAGAATHIPLLAPHGGRHTHRHAREAAAA